MEQASAVDGMVVAVASASAAQPLVQLKVVKIARMILVLARTALAVLSSCRLILLAAPIMEW